jgi:hypothetical protein
MPVSIAGELLSPHDGIISVLAFDISYGHPALYVQRTRFVEHMSSRAEFPDHVSFLHISE